MQVALGGRVAVVTGAGGGIGEAIARRLALSGARVAVTDVVEARARAVAETLPGAEAWQLDAGDWDAIGTVASAVADRMGAPTILVNNAGISRIAPSTELGRDDWSRVLDVNLTGTFRCTQAFVPGMLAAGGGAVVSIASINGLLGMPGRAAYNATKAGVIALTKVFAAEWAAQGVRVNAVAPGYVWTAMIEKAVASGVYGGADILDKVPARRYATPEDIAAAVLYLVSDGAAFVHGETLVVDGGYSSYGAPSATAHPVRDRLAL
ncbi:MAG: SDR family NAD(P)-dependent oxidoreductase [Chloroflexota bacterium]